MIYDISNISMPKEVIKLDIGRVNRVRFFDKYAIISADGFLYISDFSQPAKPLKLLPLGIKCSYFGHSVAYNLLIVPPAIIGEETTVYNIPELIKQYETCKVNNNEIIGSMARINAFQFEFIPQDIFHYKNIIFSPGVLFRSFKDMGVYATITNENGDNLSTTLEIARPSPFVYISEDKLYILNDLPVCLRVFKIL
jgi:hypothetical protein